MCLSREQLFDHELHEFIDFADEWDRHVQRISSRVIDELALQFLLPAESANMHQVFLDMYDGMIALAESCVSTVTATADFKRRYIDMMEEHQ